MLELDRLSEKIDVQLWNRIKVKLTLILFMNNLSISVLNVEYAEVKVVTICKISRPIQIEVGSRSCHFENSNSKAGKRANLNISKLLHIIWNGLYKEGKKFIRVERSFFIMGATKKICDKNKWRLLYVWEIQTYKKLDFKYANQR